MSAGWRIGAALLGLASAAAAGGSAPARATVDELVIHDKRVHAISPGLYGIFFEDINFAADGGIYAEMIWNRDFEALGRGHLDLIVPRLGSSAARVDGDIRPWAPTGEAGLSISLTNATQPFAANPHSLRIQSAGGGGVANPGYWGINAREAVPNDLSFFARSEEPTELQFRLLGQHRQMIAEVTVPVHGDWQEYHGALTPNASDPASTFEVRCAGKCDVYLDHVSLFPRDAVRGLFRRDLFEMLRANRPAFVRFPGGNYMEGNDLATRWAWKKTVGPRQGRPGHFNSAWGYWVTDGMGFYEFLVLCEELGAEPLLSVYTGYRLNGPYIPVSESGPFMQDAVDAAEFANGSPSSRYGKVRADAGHPEAFGLELFEVGNEERDMPGYASHYELIAPAIRKAEPNATIIASGRWGVPIEGSPCLTGQRCDVWDDHYYRLPDEMANMSHTYDSYDRSLPKVFVGEYAANNAKQLTLQAALAEALFMIGFENNADVVRMASFAPLFANVHGTQWVYDMILYNASAAFGIPSYYVQQLFAANLGGETLSMEGGGKLLKDATCSVAADGTVVLKAVSYGGPGGSLRLKLPEMQGYSEAKVFRLAGNAGEVNTLEEPRKVAPSIESVQADRDGSFTISVDPWSLLVVSMPQKQKPREEYV